MFVIVCIAVLCLCVVASLFDVCVFCKSNSKMCIVFVCFVLLMSV